MKLIHEIKGKYNFNKWLFLKQFGPLWPTHGKEMMMIWAFMFFLLKIKINKNDYKWHFLKLFGPIVSHSWQRDDDDLGRVGKRNSSLVEIQPNNV